MKPLSTRSQFAATVSPLAIGLAMLLSAGEAQAQTSDPTAVDPVVDQSADPDGTKDDAASPAPADRGEEPTIVVTGFRASLQSAVNTKKRQEQIVESVTAEDIGKLPDASIGESIARLPGVTSQRLSGRANVIAIRGFGPDFSQTLLNGREQTSTGDNRGVEFDQYPSEVVSQVVVYKTPAASLIGQGLVGTVDIRTVRPLDVAQRVLAVGVRGSLADLGKLNAGSKDKGFRANAAFIDKFSDDTLGVSIAASYVDEPYQTQEYNAWGFFNPDSTGNVLPAGFKSFVTSTDLRRFGLNGTVQAEVSPQLTLTADAFYSNFKDEQFKRGIELPVSFFGTAGDTSTATVEDGQYVAGTIENVQGVVRNDIFNRKADLYSFGLNGKWNSGAGWRGFLDFGWSRTDRNELSLESYSGTGYNWISGGPGTPQVDVTDTIDFECGTSGCRFDPTLDYSDPNLIRLTDPLGWGGSTIQAGYFNDRIVKDDLKQYRAELEREIGGFLSSVKVGLNYTDRKKSLRPDESFITLPNGATIATIPDEFLMRPTELDYLGLGTIVSYDARDLLDEGILILRPNTSFDIPAKAFRVNEDLWTGYVQAGVNTQLGTADLTGNVGVQLVRTDQSSSGLVAAGGVTTPTTQGTKFWNFLPSLNLAARFPSDFVVRLGLAREMQRPRLDDMRVAVSYSILQQGPNTFLNGNGGNPRLKPYLANAVDVNLEKYFGASGYVALQLFYKDINRFILRSVQPFDYTGYPVPAGPPLTTNIGLLEAPFNTKGGNLYGAEVGATLPLNVISDALDGFGITGGVGYTKSKVEDVNGNRISIPGYSKWVMNGTLFFERWGFNARGSVRYRSSFLGDFTGFGGTPTRRQAVAETIIDGQIGYDFKTGPMQGVSLFIQGQNLTDERFGSVVDTSQPMQVIDHQIYGRRFMAGVSHKF